MIPVETGCETIFRFDHVLSDYVCNRICDFMREIKGIDKIADPNVLPWFESDTFLWSTIPDDYLFARIEAHREQVASLASICFGEKLYNNFTDMVVWRTGRSMARHWDDGHSEEERRKHDYLEYRNFTSVTYLNDDFTGGETFIASENGDYISIPKKGTTVIYMGSKENAHGVTEVTSGMRFTIPMWFTRTYEKREFYNVR